MNSVQIVEEYWTSVWKNRNPDAINRFVVDDFVITVGGTDLVTKEKFIRWTRELLDKFNDLNFEVLETFQNQDGSRVASRWRVTGKNNGMLGTSPDQRPISFTGITVLAVREDGKFLHNWVERDLWELSQQLNKNDR
jgi:steroid delta-isomerase-like uncharacterized protein